MKEDEVLELLGIYIEMTEKQNEVISQLSQLVKKQAIELAHYRNMQWIEAEEAAAEKG